MKPARLSTCMLLLAGRLIVCAEQPEPEIHLTGILAFSTSKFALLEKATSPLHWRVETILAEGERDGSIEVLEIDPAVGKVKIKNAGSILELGFANDLPPAAWAPALSGDQGIGAHETSVFLRLQQADLVHVFSVYQILAGRSLIRPGSVPAFRLDLGCKNCSTNDAIRAVAEALSPKGILFRQDGQKFVVAGTEVDLTRITPQLMDLASTLAKSRKATPGTEDELLPTGVVNFPKTDLIQVLMIYQELVNRTLLRPPTLPAGVVSLRSCTPWTISEAIYAFNASLAINGVSVVPVGEKFLFVFPTPQRQKVDALLQRQMPVHSISRKEPFAARSVDFPGNKGLRQVMALYQELCGKPAEIEPDLPELPFYFHNQTALTPEELLHAFDLLLGWTGLEVTEDQSDLHLIRREKAQ